MLFRWATCKAVRHRFKVRQGLETWGIFFFFYFISNHMSLCQRKHLKIHKIKTTLMSTHSDFGSKQVFIIENDSRITSQLCSIYNYNQLCVIEMKIQILIAYLFIILFFIIIIFFFCYQNSFIAVFGDILKMDTFIIKK